MNKKTISINMLLTLVIIFASTGAWLIARSSLDKPKINTVANQIDFFMTNVSYIDLNDKGVMRNQLSAAKMTHYASEDTAILQYPHLTITDKDQKIWNISASNGKSLRGNSTIYLWDNVNIMQFDPATKSNKLIVTTSKATIYPNKKLGETTEPITIIEGQNTVHAIGAKVDFNKSTVNLLSRVMGTYK